MSMISELVVSATDAAVHGARFQTHIRQALDEGATASDLAEFTTEFKRGIDTWVKVENTQVRRKKVNNIINDVARICREELGQTIVCVSKKPNYVYEARPIKERAVPVAPSRGISSLADHILGSLTPSSSAAQVRIEELEAELKKVKKLNTRILNDLWQSPESAIGYLQSFHPIEAIGRAVVAAIKVKEEVPF